MEKGRENLRIQQWVVVIALVLFVLKLIAYFITGSIAVLTDALESTVNVIASFVGWYSLYISAKPSDENHPYGHGKAEFLSAAVEGILIIVAAIFIIYKAVYHLIYPAALRKLDYGIIIVAFSALINFIMGYVAVKIGRQNNSLALQASGHHLQSDTYSTVGIIAGLLLIYFTGIHQIDSIAAILMAFILLFIGYRITRRSLAGIMDEADKKILEQMVALLNNNRHPNWVDMHNLRVIKFGSVLHVDGHLTVPWYLTVNEAHAEIDGLTALITNEFKETMEFFVHEDGCVESSCPICIKKDCPVRQHPFQKKIEWTMENIIPNKKHKL